MPPWDKYQKPAGGPWERYAQSPAPQQEGLFTKAVEHLGRPAAAARRGLMRATEAAGEKDMLAFPKGLGEFGRSLVNWEPTEGAPSMGDIARKTKITDNYSVSDLIREPVVKEYVASSLASIPAGPIGGMIFRAGAPETYSKFREKTPDIVEGAADIGFDPLNLPLGGLVGKVGGKLVQKAPSFLKNAGARVAETMTGVPKSDYLAYIDESDAIRDLQQKYGAGWKQAFDEFRDKTRGLISDKRQGLNNLIETELNLATQKPSVNAQGIFLELEQAKAGLNPGIESERAAIQRISALQDQVRAVADPQGGVSAQDAYKLQREFWKNSKFSDPATLLPQPEGAQRAAKSAGAFTSGKVSDSVPELASANKELSALHGIESRLSSGLIDTNKAAHALVRGGTDINSPEYAQLKELGDWLGVDLNREAKQLAAYKRFSDVKLSPFDQTGKANYRLALGGLGAMGAFAGSEGTPEMRLMQALGVGAALSSPRTYKGLIDAGLGARRMGRSTVKTLQKGAEGLVSGAEKATEKAKGLLPGAKAFIKDEEGAFRPDELLKFLKPGTENTYDIQKAREVAGPPAKSLDSLGEYVASTRPKGQGLSESDWAFVTDMRKLVESGQELSPQQYSKLKYLWLEAPPPEADEIKTFVLEREHELQGKSRAQKNADEAAFNSPKAKRTSAAEVAQSGKIKPGQKITSEEGKEFEVIDVNSETGLVMMRTPEGGTSFEYADTIEEFVSEPRGLLTSLDIEPQPKGLLPEKPGEVKGFTKSPGSDYPVSGIPELKSGETFTAADGKKWKVEQYSHRDPDGGRVYWVNDPNARDWGSSVQRTERELFGDKYKDVFAKEDASRAAQEKMMSDVRKKTDAKLDVIPPKPKTEMDPHKANLLRMDFVEFMSERYGDRWLDMSDADLAAAKEAWKNDPKTLERLNDAISSRKGQVTNLSVEGGPSSPRDPRFKKGHGTLERQTRATDGGSYIKGARKRGLIKQEPDQRAWEKQKRSMRNPKILKKGEIPAVGKTYMSPDGRDIYIKKIDGALVVYDTGSGPKSTTLDVLIKSLKPKGPKK